MAARKTIATKHIPMPANWREKIRATQLINYLQKGILGEKHNGGYGREGVVELTPAKVTAALGLLKKVLPDQTENKHDVSGDITVKIVKFSDVDKA